jgi:ADP-ribose pyrophosphatase
MKFAILKYMNNHRNERIAYQGKRYTVYEWNQELYNGTSAVFERVEHAPSVTIFAVFENKLVIQYQTQPHLNHSFYAVPGGGVDPGEEPLAAAKRELLEEEGMVSETWVYWKEAGRKRDSYLWVNHVYVAKNCQKVADPDIDAGEKIEHLLYTPEEFFALLESPDFRHLDLVENLRAIRDNQEKKSDFLKELGIIT